MNTEFEVHMLSGGGIQKARDIAEIFDHTLELLKQLCPESRELSIVKTKLEEACFFAKKAMAVDNMKAMALDNEIPVDLAAVEKACKGQAPTDFPE